jgi:ATP-binding cassette, subfamily F, member 3
MITIRLDKVSFSYPSCAIFQNASCEIQERCYGVIGANGSGKTTLLKLIMNDLKPDSGNILRDKDLQVAYMAQEVDLSPTSTAFETVRQGAWRLLALEAELDALEQKFSDPNYYENEKRLEALLRKQEKQLAAFNALGGPGLEGQIKTLLRSIGFSETEIDLPIKHLSGGQKKLVGLARIIVGRPKVLLLDEPDNHLDLEGKARLQKLIEGFSGAVVIVSHDRYFLDMVVEEILEVEAGKITQLKGNYSEYMFTKQIRLQRQAAMYQVQQKEISRLEQAAKRLLMWGKVYDNAKFSNRGKNILNRIDRLDKIDQPSLDKKPIEINLAGWRGSEKVLELKALSKSFPKPNSAEQMTVLQNIHLQLRFGDRVGMIGPNGAGKSLLIKLILGQLEPDSGTINIGPSIRPGYYAQEFEILDPQKKILETICKAGNFSEPRGIAYLKKYQFDYLQRDTQVSALSGGERARLQIALITLSDANFLLLDEPTNHLDIPSCEVLEDALLDFKGTILTVSHDRYFLDRIVDRIIELHGSSTTEYLGNYADYEKIQLQQTH